MGVFAASAVTWIHTPELFPTRVRATGHAVSNSSAQIGSFCAPFLITSGSEGLVGSLLAGVCAVAMLCALILPETAGSRLDRHMDFADKMKVSFCPGVSDECLESQKPLLGDHDTLAE